MHSTTSMTERLSWSAWWLGARPATLGMSLVPVFLGTALALKQGAAFDLPSLLLAILCVLGIQAGTNFYNDLGDGQRGADGPERLGPTRLMGSGMASAAQVKRAARISFGWALAGGLLLTLLNGPIILVIGICSLLAGWAYSHGPQPLSHTRYGEICVLLFFGVIAVAGSHFLQSGQWSWQTLAYGLIPGLHASAVLLVNNWRDRAHDLRAGRRTLAGTLKEAAVPWVYAALLVLPLFWLQVLALAMKLPALGVSAWLMLLPAVVLIRRFRQRTGRELNLQLKETALLQLAFCGVQLLALLV